MIRWAGAIFWIALCSSLALAQNSTPKFQAFGGFAFFHADNGGINAVTLDEDLKEPNSPFDTNSNFTGWNAEGQYNFTRMFGIAVDGGGRYGQPITQSRFSRLSGLPNGNGYTLMAGPVVSFPGKSRFTPFIHFLFGYDRISLKASTITGVATPVPVLSTTSNDVALSPGGGVDFRVFRRFSVRLAQVDYLATTHNLNHLYGDAFPTGVFQTLGTHERNVRISTGLVVRF
jgi:opacity protein-like surface antigen